jgi:hypothetical protein
MEVILFIVFVAVCAFLLHRATRKSKEEVDVNHERKLKERRARAEQLKTPAVYTLARPDQPWHTRRNPATAGRSQAETFGLLSESHDAEYDGYSRRDRHHVTGKARIKGEGHIDDAALAR